jgi:hypothetical protein
MRLFNSLISSSFKTDSNGRIVFYPFGIFGKSYILPSERTKYDIEYFLKRFFIISFTLTIGIGVGASWIISFIIVPIFIIFLYFKVKKITSNLESSNEEYDFNENLKQSVVKHSMEKLWLLFFICAFGLLFCIVQLVFNPDAFFIGLLGIVFFLSGAIMLFKMVCIKRQLTIHSKGPR